MMFPPSFAKRLRPQAVWLIALVCFRHMSIIPLISKKASKSFDSSSVLLQGFLTPVLKLKFFHFSRPLRCPYDTVYTVCESCMQDIAFKNTKFFIF